ncbi:MAG: hypothetical protein QM758_13775 [Armatimonas sp.]
MSEQLSISKYKKSRHWAVREAGSGSLVCLCVYRKGAAEVVRRITGQTPKPLKRQRSAKAEYVLQARSGGRP